jgi:ADP-ribose pyrophosphatase
VYLTRQFRYALGQESLEVVSGAVGANEPILEAARRELREEVGIAADAWTALGRVDPDTSIVREPVWLFLAEHLRFISPEPEGTESIQLVKLPGAEAVRQVLVGGITHAPSCVLILKAHLARAALAQGDAMVANTPSPLSPFRTPAS